LIVNTKTLSFKLRFFTNIPKMKCIKADNLQLFQAREINNA